MKKKGERKKRQTNKLSNKQTYKQRDTVQRNDVFRINRGKREKEKKKQTDIRTNTRTKRHSIQRDFSW